MGRVRKYANAEEARQAKLKQMRENYQKRKAERDRLKAEAIANGQEPPKEARSTRRKNITWDDVPKLFKELGLSTIPMTSCKVSYGVPEIERSKSPGLKIPKSVFVRA